MFYRFLHLDLVDLDAEQFMFEIIVEIEAVSVLHVLPSRVLVEDASLSAGQGLQRPPELSLLCAGQETVCDTRPLSHNRIVVLHV